MPLLHFVWMLPLFGILLFLDLSTKQWAERVLKDADPIPLIRGVLEFQYLENAGAAFGMMQRAQGFFVISAIAVLIIITSVLFNMPGGKRHLPLRVNVVVIAAGALGNLIDRLRFQYVRDFIYFKLINFPIFNVADICVTCGAIVLMILLLWFYKDKDLEFLSSSKRRETPQPGKKKKK
ncbi:MAG: signal peptidase II [Lachnospiraceae bacterium]|nr:signal peptidase II [Lachnospiraceae bacterium]